MSSLHSEDEHEEINVDTDSRLSAGGEQSDHESDKHSESYSPRNRLNMHSISPSDLHRGHISSQPHPAQISLPFSISRLLGKSFDDEKNLVNVARRGVDELMDRIHRRDSNEDTTDEEGRLRSDNDSEQGRDEFRRARTNDESNNDNESESAKDEYRRLTNAAESEMENAREEYRRLSENGMANCFMGPMGVGYGVPGFYGSGGGVLRVPAQRALASLPWGLSMDPRQAAAAAFAHQVVKDRLNGKY